MIGLLGCCSCAAEGCLFTICARVYCGSSLDAFRVYSIAIRSTPGGSVLASGSTSGGSKCLDFTGSAGTYYVTASRVGFSKTTTVTVTECGSTTYADFYYCTADTTVSLNGCAGSGIAGATVAFTGDFTGSGTVSALLYADVTISGTIPDNCSITATVTVTMPALSPYANISKVVTFNLCEGLTLDLNYKTVDITWSFSESSETCGVTDFVGTFTGTDVGCSDDDGGCQITLPSNPTFPITITGTLSSTCDRLDMPATVDLDLDRCETGLGFTFGQVTIADGYICDDMGILPTTLSYSDNLGSCDLVYDDTFTLFSLTGWWVGYYTLSDDVYVKDSNPTVYLTPGFGDEYNVYCEDLGSTARVNVAYKDGNFYRYIPYCCLGEICNFDSGDGSFEQYMHVRQSSAGFSSLGDAVMYEGSITSGAVGCNTVDMDGEGTVEASPPFCWLNSSTCKDSRFVSPFDATITG
jgi:hypothetical protein